MNAITRPKPRSALVAATLVALLSGVPALADMPVEPPAGPLVDIVGYWKTDSVYLNCTTGVPLRTPFVALNTFFADGNVIENSSGFSPANRSISHGRWQQTGKRSFIARSELQLFQGPPPAPPSAPAVNTYSGYQVLERHFELSADGNALTATGVVTRFDTAGVVTLSFCLTETGVRQPEPSPH